MLMVAIVYCYINGFCYICNVMICDNYKYSSVVLAYYIVALMNQRGLEINMTKLQKLLYIAYGTYLAIKNQRLTNEHPQAWPYGPVFPTTRNRLLKKRFITYKFIYSGT